MRIIVSGGGTAGHIYPALTVAERMIADGHEVHFVGGTSGPEGDLARDQGVPFHALPARGFDRSNPLSLIGALSLAALSTFRAVRLLSCLRPSVVVGFGGYASIPTGLAAVIARIPLVLHEQNAVPGLASRFLARWACGIGVTYESGRARGSWAHGAELTGNPVRRSILSADRGAARGSYGLDDGDVLVLVFGGSRGARRLNETIVSMAPLLLERPHVVVLHVAGRAEVSAVRDAVGGLRSRMGSAAERYRVVDYLDDMGSALAASDVVLARAGATTIAEITAVGRAAVLVPYPYATDDHQTRNARHLVDAGAAFLCSDAELGSAVFVEKVAALVDDAVKRESMARVSRALGHPDATSRLASLVLRCARQEREEVHV